MREAKKVTAEQFCEAWCAAWEDAKAEKPEQAGAETAEEKFVRKFQETSAKPKTTQYMLKDDNAFLHCVKKQLENKLGRSMICWQEQLFRVDMGFVSKKDNGFMNSYGEHTMPLFIDVLIEHENEIKKIHDEMWKLIFFRSPLKVIITYAHDSTATAKINEMIKFLHQANKAFPENENTEYLFIVGALNDAYQMSWSIEKYKFDKTPSRQKLKPR